MQQLGKNRIGLWMGGFILVMWIGVTSADPANDYSNAYQKAIAEKKMLWTIVSDKKIDLPKDEAVQKLIDAGIVVQLQPDVKIGKQSLQEFFSLTPQNRSEGVLILGDFKDPNSVTFKAVSGVLSKLKSRQPSEISEFYFNSTYPLTDLERDMADEATRYRAQFGRPPLKISGRLMNAAREYTQSGFYNHATAREYATKNGFQGSVTENLARGSMTGRRVIQYWGEPGIGHEMQMRGLIKMNGRWIDGGFTHMGVSGSNGNWVIYFGSAAE